MRRPGVALTLHAIAAGGRDAFYGGAFGEGLLALGAGHFAEADLALSQADWVDPLAAEAFGVELLTIGPASQGYLLLGAARLAERAGLPDDPDDARWAHVLVEAASTASFDRPDVLHDWAEGAALLAAIDGARRSRRRRARRQPAGRRHRRATRRTCARPTRAGRLSA